MVEVSRYAPPDSEWELVDTFGTMKAAIKFVRREEAIHPNLYGDQVAPDVKYYLLVEIR